MTEPTSPWTVRALSPELLPDFLRFFDGDAFADNPKWSSCYCQCFYEDHTTVVWSERTADQNRGHACRRAREGTMQGYLAYGGDEIVGWCNAAPRPMLHALDDEPLPDADRIGAVLCFIVRPQFREQGVARALLAAACDGLRAQGLALVEANPRPAGGTAAEQHFGPLALYLSAGFTIDRTDDDGSVYVRKTL